MKYTYTFNQIRGNTRDRVMKTFMNYERTVSYFGQINADDYFIADSGVIEAETPEAACEKLFSMYNINHPAGYAGRSMSVSDIVNLWDNSKEPPEKTSWYCDSVGFVRI